MPRAESAKAGDDAFKVVTPRLLDSQGRIQMAEAPWQEQTGCVTDNSRFFVVNHYDRPDWHSPASEISIVTLDGEEHRLTYDQVRALPSVTFAAVAECAGMSRGFLPTPAPGQQFGHGLAGNAVWTGASVKTLLDAIGSRGEFDTLVIRGADSGVTKPEDEFSDFSKGLPRLKAMHPDTVLAWEMNGEALPHIHGGPLRMVVPGWYGTWWVKWVTRLELINGAYGGFWQTTRYSYQGDGFPQAEVVTEVLPRSVIVHPKEGSSCGAEDLVVRGYAWAGEQSIDTVELSVDGGQHWAACTISRECGRYGWVEWECAVNIAMAAPSMKLSSRATDRAGRRQDWSSRPNRLGYANNGIHSIKLLRNEAAAQHDGGDDTIRVGQ